MSLRVGEIHALFRLDDAGFRRTLSQAERLLTGSTRRMTLALGGVAGALTANTISAARWADEIDRVRRQTGMSAEAVQRLGYVARQTGADTATLESGLRSLARRADEAARGNTQFLRGFERLGLTQEQVRAQLYD